MEVVDKEESSSKTSEGSKPDVQKSNEGAEASTTQAAVQSSTSSSTWVSPARDRPSADAPVRKLTVNLLATYKRINTVYYAAKAKRKAARNKTWDDKDNNYIVKTGEIFASRYKIDKRIGKGSFGQVVRAYDQEKKVNVAIKIIKGHKAFSKQAQTEIKILEFLNTHDQRDRMGIVRLLRHFVFRDHVCLVFEMLSFNLYDLLRNTEFKGVSLMLIRKFAQQLLQSLEFLSSPEINIIHCDLKPENILLRGATSSIIKVIDFGSSCFGNEQMYKYIQSRFYRSPEVIMGVPYTVSIDMWSLGCILVELHTGEPVFNGSDEPQHMQFIVEMLGFPPPSLFAAASSSKLQKLFVVEKSATGEPTYKLKKKRSKRKTLEQLIGVSTGGPEGRRKGEHNHSEADYGVFLDFVQRMLCYHGTRRMKPTEALRHPFMRKSSEPEKREHSSAATSPTADGMSPGRDASTQTKESLQKRSRSGPSPASSKTM